MPDPSPFNQPHLSPAPSPAIPPPAAHPHPEPPHPAENSPQPVTPGRAVHYVLRQGRNAGQVRPAVVIVVHEQDPSSVNLHVLLDGSNDVDCEFGASFLQLVGWATSARYASGNPDGTFTPGTWHWPPRA